MNIVDRYRSGLQGYVPDPKADREFERHLRANSQYVFAGDAIDDYGLNEVGKDTVSLPYLAALELYPHCLPGGAQQHGSCVAWATRNAIMVSFCAYLKYGQNLEKFAAPVVSPLAASHGAFSQEAIYWYRRHRGDGWQGSAAAQVVTSECGLVPRQKYDELGLDLTEYNPNTEVKYGLTVPPENIRKAFSQHLCGSATVCKGWDQVRSMVASGYALQTCGMEAWEFKRDAYGVARRDRRDSWSHALAVIAVDDRPDIRERYSSDGKSGLVLVQNSWGNVNEGPDIVFGTSHRIPPGSFWSRWEDFKDRYMVALGPSKGWPAMRLPNWGTEGIL